MAALAPWAGGYGGLDPYDTAIWETLDIDENWSWWDWRQPRRRHPQRNRGDNQGVVPTAVDWRETEAAHIITLELPGVRKEELKVQVEDDRFLEISGERGKEEEEKTGETWHLKERRRGNFKRRIKLPQNANLDQIKCSLDHGIVTVTIPKKETAPRPTPKIRTIELA
ncbi:hypothetical protein ACLOJK_028895 [Asimina triloba]